MFDSRILRDSQSNSIRGVGGVSGRGVRPADTVLYDTEVRVIADDIDNPSGFVYYPVWELFPRHESYIRNQREVISPKIPITGIIESDSYW